MSTAIRLKPARIRTICTSTPRRIVQPSVPTPPYAPSGIQPTKYPGYKAKTPLRNTGSGFGSWFRFSSSSKTGQSQPGPSRNQWIKSTLTGAGLVVASGVLYLAYRLYMSHTVYPSEVAAPLRKALLAIEHKEYKMAEQYYQEAVTIARLLPLSSFDSNPQDAYLKLTGLESAYAELLETQGRLRAAFNVYMDSLNGLRAALAASSTELEDSYASHTSPLSGKVRLRGVGIAYNAAYLAQNLGLTQEEEDLRKWSVEEVFKIGSGVTGIPTQELARNPDLEVRLPEWMKRVDLASPCEQLASFYVRTGRIEYALPLYQTAYNLITSSRSAPPPLFLCFAAQVLTGMCGAVMSDPTAAPPPAATKSKASSSTSNKRHEPTPAQIETMQSWTTQAIDLTSSARKQIISSSPDPFCERTWSAVLHNRGMVELVKKNYDEAERQFIAALEHSRNIHFIEGVEQSKFALGELYRRRKEES